jgi:hypothetical protein
VGLDFRGLGQGNGMMLSFWANTPLPQFIFYVIFSPFFILLLLSLLRLMRNPGMMTKSILTAPVLFMEPKKGETDFLLKKG